GTAGRIENAQVGVHVVYASQRGHAFIDRELYLPKSWSEDDARRRAAGVPEQVGFATKPALAATMIVRALDAGTPAAWVTGDEVYGNDPALRGLLEQRRVGYVLAVACDHRVITGAGKMQARDLAARLPGHAWNRLSAGRGAKGHRYYDWALIDLDTAEPGCHWLLIRRSIRDGELAFYRAYAPTPVPLNTLVRVAGRRWAIEESFQTGKGLTGLDEHQVRTWTSWQRWTILVMLAHASLAITAATELDQDTDPPGLIRLTMNEIRHLFTALADHRPRDPLHLLRWSHWRRRHQARARRSHYQRQALQLG
ncbi:MAG: IS701 family transposase, partial [Jiangellaceae bacterium]